MVQPLSAEKLSKTLTSLPDWRYDTSRKAIYRQIRFNNFRETLSAMVRIGLEAEIADHHPEWANTYNVLDIWLTTHDADGVSDLDVALAKTIDQIAVAQAA